MNSVCANMLEGIVSPPLSPATVHPTFAGRRDTAAVEVPWFLFFTTMFLFQLHPVLASWLRPSHRKSYKHSHLLTRTTCNLQIFTELFYVLATSLAVLANLMLEIKTTPIYFIRIIENIWNIVYCTGATIGKQNKSWLLLSTPQHDSTFWF